MSLQQRLLHNVRRIKLPLQPPIQLGIRECPQIEVNSRGVARASVAMFTSIKRRVSSELSLVPFCDRLWHVNPLQRENPLVLGVKLFVMCQDEIDQALPINQPQIAFAATKMNACLVKVPSVTTSPYSADSTFP